MLMNPYVEGEIVDESNTSLMREIIHRLDEEISSHYRAIEDRREIRWSFQFELTGGEPPEMPSAANRTVPGAGREMPEMRIPTRNG